MIRGKVDASGAVLATSFPTGYASYVDHDWLTATEGYVPSLSFAPEGEVFWCGTPLGHVGARTDAAAIAARALIGVAREAASAAAKRVQGPAEVVGSGLIAVHVRRLLAESGGQLNTRLTAIVDTTGDPESIRSALERVSDLGTVVLAGEASGRRFDLDLYTTVHKRGLVLIGIAPPEIGDTESEHASGVDDELTFSRDALAEASSGKPVSSASPWYRLVS